MKRLCLSLSILILVLAFHTQTPAVEVEFHGDLNHRFQYTNRADFLTLDSTSNRPEINDGDVDDNFGEIKYRLWVEGATNEGDVKGVVATEIGGLRFGENSKADFSGDDIQFEVRWAYIDVQMPWIERTARFKIGLQPFKVNKYLWQETAAGVAFNSTIGDSTDYVLAWMRGAEYDKTAENSDENDDRTDLDSYLVRFNTNPAGAKAGFFVLYQGFDSDGNPSTLDSRDWQVKQFKQAGDPAVDFDLWSFGTDGSVNFNPFFINWDLIYQNGDFSDLAYTDFASGTGRTGDFDLSAYFVHFDIGAQINNWKFTYTFWYASGDDDPTDDDFDAFISTDVDITDSIALFEGGYADDNYFTERPYIADKGFIMNRLGVDFTATQKLTVGGALLYLMTAEDFEYIAAANGDSVSENDLGWEIDAYIKYQLFPNVEVAFNFGYLFAGDALDVYEVPAIQDGSSDEDIYIASARLRYKF
ncbi:MAG: hypothetical protein QNJ17_14655 [Desulfocapsaceae bacterium]|nr:hypothetical protein [Desulfocapsaceae bacterium]